MNRQDSERGEALFLTVPELARATLMKPSFIYQKINEGKIVARRFGKALRIPKSEFDRIIKQGLPEE